MTKKDTYYNGQKTSKQKPYVEEEQTLFVFNLNIFYCQIYTMGLNTSFTTYIKFSPVSYIHRSDREHDG